MAYNFIPTSIKEIASAQLKTGAVLVALYEFIVKKSPSAKAPLAIDKSKPTSVKVVRALNGTVSLSDLKRVAPGISISWGNGSRGGAGAANKGIGFEKDLETDLIAYKEEGVDSERIKAKTFLIDLEKYYGLDSAKSIDVKSEGALNKRRPLTFMGNQPIISGGGSDYNVGSTVTDLTLMKDGKPIYLSLKYGATVTFFNIGVSTILKPTEINSGMIADNGGKSLLDMFGIDNVKFCRLFTEHGIGGLNEEVQDVTSKIDRGVLTRFIMSGIGYGYHLVHKDKNTIHHFEMTKGKLQNACTPQKVIVRYPFGSAKRVDVTVITPVFQLKINIRNKQGGLYPTHVMADYKIIGHP